MKELGELLLRRRFLIKADRMFKKPKPGRKRLVKWPKKLVPTENPWVSLLRGLASAISTSAFQMGCMSFTLLYRIHSAVYTLHAGWCSCVRPLLHALRPLQPVG